MKQKTVRIGVVSDTHLSGFDENLKKNIDEHFSDVDLVFHAGDLVDLCVLDLFGDTEAGRYPATWTTAGCGGSSR